MIGNLLEVLDSSAYSNEVFQGTRINAHRLILAACSSYFRDIFNNEVAENRLQEIEIADMEASTLDALDVCGEVMMRLLKPSNCLGIRAFADTYACQELLRCADKYISHNFQDVVGSEEFLQLSVDRLIEVISCEDLHVQSEEQVFAAVLEWIKFDLAARKQFLPRVLEHVRTFVLSARIPCQHDRQRRNYLLLQLFTHERLKVEAPRIRPRIPFKCNEVLYAVGGAVNGEALSSVEKLDLRIANPSWVRVAPMSKKRSSIGLTSYFERLYVIGGYDGQTSLSSNE
ncbi:kelch repeat protein, partial [Ostertagia ostertagi]